MPRQYRLPKIHRLCSQTAIDRLFLRNGIEGGGSAIAYPMRAVWAPRAQRSTEVAEAVENAASGEETAPETVPENAGEQTSGYVPAAKFLISIPKKRLHHAVDRVLMRRRIREAYRLSRPRYVPDGTAQPLDVAFIYVADHPVDYTRVNSAMKRLLKKIFPAQ